ncbi:uncharacterized protein LOC141539206 isoform X2 [Sminthopsis crassicaudata]|uniref:uncharacterized protein LOC141539206 isoform X2 n=2 Tax=Sminthopsis crassicaudata TaxID=9301 RepID=UPI003D685A69
MDLLVGNTMRNIIGLWTISYLFSVASFFTYRKRLQTQTFLWHLIGILSVSNAMEVGLCIYYLWTKHSCPGEEEIKPMDPQVVNMMRDIIGLWATSCLFSISTIFINRKRLQTHTFLWHLYGILSVTYSMEVGLCICYLWTKHSCPAPVNYSQSQTRGHFIIEHKQDGDLHNE